MNKKIRSYYFGILAEYYVMFLLFLNGYKLISRRLKTRIGEIDLLMVKGCDLVAFEVKARKSNDCEIGEIVSSHQLKRIANSLKLFLNKNEKYSSFNVRIDIVLVHSMFKVEFLKNVWSF